MSKITKQVKKLDQDKEYVFARWAIEQGWKAVPGKYQWKKGKDVLTLTQLRKVFNDYKESRK